MKKIINIIFKILNILLIILSISILAIVLKNNIFPTKYLLPLSIAIIIILLIITIQNLNKNIKTITKIISRTLIIILTIILIITLHYLYNTINFVTNITQNKYQTEEFYVVVLKENNYNNFEDIANKSMGIYENTISKYNDSLNKIIENTNIKLKKYNTYYETATSLLNKQTESIYISSQHKEILEQELPKFKTSTKILKKDLQKIKTSNTEEKTDLNKSFNIYISGIDTYKDISTLSRSDVNMIITINPTTNKILLTSIPRDYYVKIPGTTGYKDKLTHTGIYGIDTSIRTIENLLNIKIDYYIKVNFTTVVDIVDAIGGIEIYSDKTFRAYTSRKCWYTEGKNYLNGKCALAYARERYAYEEGDRHRVKNQQDIIKAIINKGLSSKKFITNYTEILKDLETNFQTSIPTELIYKLVNNQLDKMPSWQIEQISINGYDSYNYTYSYPKSKLYVMEPNINTIEESKNKINSIYTN